MALYHRRSALQLLSAAGLTALVSSRGLASPTITVHKDPTCSCCAGWADHLRAESFPVVVVVEVDLKALKKRLGVPEELSSCHTAEIDGYIVEGHVPAAAIKRLLSERPSAVGVAVPGMPAGSPGMQGEPEVYEVVLFGAAGRTSFGRYRGADAL